MGDETKMDSEKEGGKLDKILSHLDSFKTRMDAADEERKADRVRMDAVCAKMDAADEKAKADAAADEKKDDKKADADEDKKEDKKADSKKDAEEDDKKEEKKADAAVDHTPGLRAQIAALEARLPMEVKEEDRLQYVGAQSKAERVAQAFGDSAGAPRWLNGETVPQYRRRLLTKYKAHSADWKDADLSKIEDSAALNVIETRIYADAMQAALRPTDVPDGQLRMVTERDTSGRTINRFVGSPTAAGAPFRNARQRGRFVRPAQH